MRRNWLFGLQAELDKQYFSVKEQILVEFLKLVSLMGPSELFQE